MTDNFGTEIGGTQALTHMLDGMRKGTFDIRAEGTAIHLGKKLGSGGGTKTVYDVRIDEKPFALALPNTTDGAEKVSEKWKIALQEPANTDRVRAMGFYTNPVCEILPISLNGVHFPALKMMRFEDLPFQVMDGKDVNSSTVRGDILPDTLDSFQFQAYMQTILPDINALIDNGVRVGKDSLNMCLVDGQPRIFLSDLGLMQIQPFEQTETADVMGGYISNALTAFVNGLPHATYQQHKAFFEGDTFRFDNPNRMTNVLTARLISEDQTT